MGWVFIILGLIVISAGGFLTYYGQALLGEKPPAQPLTISERLLTPSQERLLALLFRYQRDFAASKLVVGRKGRLFFDDLARRDSVKINFLTELYGSKDDDNSRLSDFISLMESLPTEYVRFHAETRFDNPFVVSITSDGVKYLREPK
jgi:hypothetical protein